MTPGHRYCLKCWYVLDGLTSPRCPECGRQFNAANPRTYATQTRLADQFSRMRPVVWLAMTFILLEFVCIGFVWNTMGEVMSSFWTMIVIAGNVIVFTSILFRRRWLTASLLIALVLITCPYPIFLQIELGIIESEARQIIAYADGVRLKTGSYPPNLSGYQFQRPWTSSNIHYSLDDGFSLAWWAFEAGVSHSYTPHRGFGYYPD